MAAPRLIAASTGATDAGGDWTATCHAPGAAGRIIILQVLQDGSTSAAVTLDSATNIENLSGTDNAWTSIGSFAVGSPTSAYQRIWIGRSLSTSAPTATGSNSTSEDLYWRFYEFDNVSTGTTLAEVLENGTAGSTSNTAGTDGTVTDAGVTTLGPDRLALNFVAISDDNAIASFTGETGGDWTEAVAEYAESSGTDGSIGLQTAYPADVGAATGSGGQTNVGSSAAEAQAAQSFTAPSTGTVVYAAGAVWKTGSPTDNLVFEIQTDNSGQPSGTVVGTGGTIAGASLSTGGIHQSVAVSASVTSGTRYWLVWRRSGSLDASNYYRIAATLVDVLSGEQGMELTSGTWTAIGAGSEDHIFRIYIDDSAVTIDGGTFTNADATDGWDLTRDWEICYAKDHNIPVPVAKEKPWSTDENLWSRSIEGGMLEDPAYHPPEEIYSWTVAREKGPDRPE